MSVLTIKISSDNPDVLMSIDRGGIISKKFVSIDDLTSSLVDSYKFSTGIIPKGTRFFSGTLSNYVIGIETPAITKLCNLFIDKEKIQKLLPIPRCLFTFRIRDNSVEESFIHALKCSIFNESDDLFKFPYGNASNYGSICWGDVKTDKIKSPIEVISLISHFFCSYFNGDLFNNDTVNFHTLGLKDYSFSNFITIMEGQEKFPIDALNKDREYMIVSQLMKVK